MRGRRAKTHSFETVEAILGLYLAEKKLWGVVYESKKYAAMNRCIAVIQGSQELSVFATDFTLLTLASQAAVEATRSDENPAHDFPVHLVAFLLAAVGIVLHGRLQTLKQALLILIQKLLVYALSSEA
jgi:hypothetical protein